MGSKFHTAQTYGDPLGEALRDYYKGDTTATITVINSVGDDVEMQAEYFFRDYSEMPYMEKMALQIAEGRILDAGAGSGCHSIYLQEKGMDVTALEISVKLSEIIVQRGIKQCLAIDIMDMNDERFDTILLLMNGAGMAKQLKLLPGFLRHLAKLLNTKGSILLESTDINYIFHEEDGSVLIDLSKEYYGEMQYQMIYKDVTGKPFDWLHIDYYTLESTAMNLGFRCEKLYEEEDSHYLARLTR